MFEGWFEPTDVKSSNTKNEDDAQSIPRLLRRTSFMAKDGVITQEEKEKIKYALLGTNYVNRDRVGKAIVSFEQDKGVAELQNALTMLSSPSLNSRGGVPSTPVVQMMRGMESKETLSNGSMMMDIDTTIHSTSEKKKRPRSISLKQALSSAQKDTKQYRRRKPRRWTKEEDDSLRAAVAKHGGKNWKAIAVDVPTRTHVQCLQRWKKVLRPGLVKGQWSTEEDTLLVSLLRQANMKPDWTVLAKSVAGRTPKQCRERWFNHLDPNVNKGEWTVEEDKIIWEAQKELGNRWSRIARMLKGRTENAVKIRWKSLHRQKNGGGTTVNRKRRSPKSKSRPKTRPRSSSTQKAAAASYRNRMRTNNNDNNNYIVYQPRPLPGIPETSGMIMDGFLVPHSSNIPLTSSPDTDPLWFTGSSGSLLPANSPGLLQGRNRTYSADMGFGVTPPDMLLSGMSRPRKNTRDSVSGVLDLLDEVDTPIEGTQTPMQIDSLDPKDIFGSHNENKIADLIMSRQTPTGGGGGGGGRRGKGRGDSYGFLRDVDVDDLLREKGW